MHFFHLQGAKKTHWSLDWLCDPLPAGGRQWEWFLLYSFGEPPLLLSSWDCSFTFARKACAPPPPTPRVEQGKRLHCPDCRADSQLWLWCVSLSGVPGVGAQRAARSPRESPAHRGGWAGWDFPPQPSGHRGAFRKAGAKKPFSSWCEGRLSTKALGQDELKTAHLDRKSVV